MQALQWMVMAALGLGAGASLVVQQVLVADLRASLGSAGWAALVSYLGGTLAVILLILALREPLVAGSLSRASPLSLAAGPFGVVYMVVAILLIPRMGAASVLALVVAGQMLASLAFDHFGLFGLARQPADLRRLAGALMLVGGVVLIRP